MNKQSIPIDFLTLLFQTHQIDLTKLKIKSSSAVSTKSFNMITIAKISKLLL